MLHSDKAGNMTNNSNGYMTGNSTTLFIFCLYDNEHSAKNCASGPFSSLPLESRHALLARDFDADIQNVTGNNEAASRENFPVWLFILVCICIIGISIALLVFIRFFCQRWRKMLAENSAISIPKIDEDLFVVEMHNLKKKKKYKSDAEIESHSLLHLEAECNLSCNSGETSSTGYVSDTYDEIHSNSDEENTSQEKDVNNLSNFLPVLNQKSVIHCEAKVVEENPTKPDSINVNSVKRRDTQNHDAVKTNMIVLRSPNKTPGQEDSAVATVDPLDVQVSAANGADLDMRRLNWTKIFLFLIEHIYASEYILFFNLLLDNAGCRNTICAIESVQFNKKGNFKEITFELLQFWLKGARPKAKPKDIEDVFENLRWNVHLYDFREYMRDPPYLSEENNWNEPSFSSENMIGEKQRLFLHQRSIPQIQGQDYTCERQQQTNNIAVSSENIEEHISFTNHNRIDVFESKRRICRRNTTRRSGDDINEISSKYRKVETRSTGGKESKERRCMRCRNNCKFQSQKRKRAFANNYVSSSSTATTSSAATSSLPSSTLSPETCNGFSSGYGSMSSNNIERGTELAVSNNTWNGIMSEDTFPETKDAKAPNKRELLRNSLGCSYNSESPHRRPSLTPCQKAKKNLSSKNLLTRSQNGNSFSGIPCKSTINSWNVSSTECPLLTSGVIKEQLTRKRKRNIDKKHPLETKKQMVSKKRPKSYRRKRTLHTNKTLPGEKKYKSAYAGLIETLIEDLVARLTPSRDDILSLKFQSYSDANLFVTTWNEKIYVVFSEKHCLPVREREWNTIQTYVKNVRNVVMTKTSKRYNQNRDFLFLNHNGDPLV